MADAVLSHLIDGCRLAVAQRQRRAPTVVFISGLGEPGSVWQPVIAKLGTVSFLTYDRAGCGASDLLVGDLAERPRPAVWAAEQLRSLIDQAKVTSPVILVGHSLGGLIADAYATLWPSEVAAQVLVDATEPRLYPDLGEATMIDGAEPGGWPVDWAATARDIRKSAPSERVRTVVIGSAMWRWLRTKEPKRYLPYTPAEVDQRWQRWQLALAERWAGHLVIPHDAGHRVHEEAPQLVATVIGSAIEAVRRRSEIELDPIGLAADGGSPRVTWTSEGPQAWPALAPDQRSERGIGARELL